MTSRARITFAAFSFLIAGLPLSSSPGQVPAPPGPPVRLHSALVTSVLRDLCVITNSCTPPKPVITSVMPFSTMTPGGAIIVQGQNFAAGDGSFGQFELVLCSTAPCTFDFGTALKLEHLQWGDTFAAGTIPTYWGPQGDNGGSLFIVRSDGAISNPIPVGFIATRDFAVLPASDVQSNCSNGADGQNTCGGWGGSVSALHLTTSGQDMGVDRFTATLQNGWVFYAMDFANDSSNAYGVAKPPGGFNPLSNSLDLSVYWAEDGGGGWPDGHGSWTTYHVNLYIMGPKGVPWK